MSINVAVGLGIPFLGTALGAACVFLLQGEMNATVRKTMLGFAAGVMVAASVWSLLIPAMDLSEGMGKLAFIPAAAGFLLGILFLLVLDRVGPHLHVDSEEQEGVKSNWKKSTMLILAVTLHNIPEGISIAVPIYYANNSKKEALFKTFLSGIAEPIGALLAYIFLSKYITDSLISLILILVGGIMITLAIEGILPKAKKYNLNKYLYMGMFIGFGLVLFNYFVFK